MTEKGKQRNGNEPASGHGRNEPGKAASLSVGERDASRIVDRDVPSREFAGDSPRQRPVWRDQGSGGVLQFQRLAQGERDGERFFPRLGGLHESDVGERIDVGGRYHARLPPVG